MNAARLQAHFIFANKRRASRAKRIQRLTIYFYKKEK
jgi:hypothetical protein